MGRDLSDYQISSMKFTLFDADGDGKIAPSELGILMRSLGGNPSSTKTIIAEEKFNSPFDFNRFLELMSFKGVIAIKLRCSQFSSDPLLSSQLGCPKTKHLVADLAPTSAGPFLSPGPLPPIHVFGPFLSSFGPSSEPNPLSTPPCTSSVSHSIPEPAFSLPSTKRTLKKNKKGKASVIPPCGQILLGGHKATLLNNAIKSHPPPSNRKNGGNFSGKKFAKKPDQYFFSGGETSRLDTVGVLLGFNNEASPSKTGNSNSVFGSASGYQ
ncbi:hypothetical protein SSX86_018113 [Deinandra increscens subsp. villosa]|uniref:EF-hand domain-containing protein n=1 Tax=Deinandra increscens subsp. villosa TaxID=3103831 RepID=A0AAP0CUQ3_9ASTR